MFEFVLTSENLSDNDLKVKVDQNGK